MAEQPSIEQQLRACEKSHIPLTQETMLAHEWAAIHATRDAGHKDPKLLRPMLLQLVHDARGPQGNPYAHQLLKKLSAHIAGQGWEYA